MTTEAITIETGAHVVHFYEDDERLVATVGDYLAAAMGAGDAAFVIATRDHRDALATHLDAAGIDVAEARRTETFVTIDAAATLARFHVDGQIAGDDFRAVIGGTIRRVARHTGRPVRCYGEMVSLLWGAGAVTAALELEDHWNDLGRELAFSLLCSYPNQSVAGPEFSYARWDVCQLHSDVVYTHLRAERHFRPRQPGAAATPGTFAALTELSRMHLAPEVHQASGMVAVQLGIGTAEALDRLRSLATDHGRTLDEVAEDVIIGRRRVQDPAPGPQ